MISSELSADELISEELTPSGQYISYKRSCSETFPPKRLSDESSSEDVYSSKSSSDIGVGLSLLLQRFQLSNKYCWYKFFLSGS